MAEDRSKGPEASEAVGMVPAQQAGDRAMGSRLQWALWVTIGLIAVKAIGAWLSHSLALWADAGHSLTDVAAIALSWYAWRQAQRPPTPSMTFGYARMEVLVALLNGVVLLGLAGALVVEAVVRALHPTAVSPAIMLAAATVALGVDMVLALWFHGSRNVNIRATWIHLLTDALSSFGVLVGAVLIWVSRSGIVDPVLTVLIAAAMVIGTWRVLQEAIAILLEATPPGIAIPRVEAALSAVSGVSRVHDLHVWRIGSGQTALACHVAVPESLLVADSQDLLCRLHDALEPLGVTHVTIQLETEREAHDEPDW